MRDAKECSQQQIPLRNMHAEEINNDGKHLYQNTSKVNILSKPWRVYDIIVTYAVFLGLVSITICYISHLPYIKCTIHVHYIWD